MTSIREAVRRLLQPPQPLPAGIYHYQAPPEDPRNFRLHLRLEEDGKGLLVVNASTVLHLNQTAGEYAYLLIQQTSPDQAAQHIARRYRISKEQALQDFLDFKERIELLIERQDVDPEIFLGFEPKEHEILSAPLRLDCALTGRLPAGCDPQYYPVALPGEEISTKDWEQILKKSWDFGILQVIFTGGEPSQRDDLIPLIRCAESNGQVAGLVSDGFRCLDPDYLDEILQSGLDHFVLLYQPGIAKSWSVLERLISVDLFVTVHLTLTPSNQVEIENSLERILSSGVHAVSLSISDRSLTEQLFRLRNRLAMSERSIIWGLPVPYYGADPISLELERPATYEALACVYADPAGRVHLSPTSPEVVGDLITEPWEKIWTKIAPRSHQG